MIRKPLAACAVLVATLILAACSGQRFAALQSEYYELMKSKDALEKGDAFHGRLSGAKFVPADRSAVAAKEDVNGALYALANDAEKVADEARDARTKIGLLRLAGLAAWQSEEHGEEKLIKISLKGQGLCTGIPKNMFGAPRDCALLFGLGSLAAADTLARGLKALKQGQDPDSPRLPAALRPSVEGFTSDFQTNWSAFHRVLQRLSGISRLSPTVRAFFERQRFRSFCNYWSLMQTSELVAGIDDYLPVQNGILCRARGQLGDWAGKKCPSNLPDFKAVACGG